MHGGNVSSATGVAKPEPARPDRTVSPFANRGERIQSALMKGRLVAFVVFLFLVVLAGLFAVLHLLGFGRGAGRPAAQNTAVVLQQVQALSQLVTVKYVLQKVVILEDVKWYGENRVLLVAQGVVKAGVDFKKMTVNDLSVQGDRVILKLPPAEITDAYLDDKETRVVERSTGMLRFFDKDLEQDARRQAIDDIRRGARVSGILQDADERAKLQLAALFGQMGRQVEFR